MVVLRALAAVAVAAYLVWFVACDNKIENKERKLPCTGQADQRVEDMFKSPLEDAVRNAESAGTQQGRIDAALLKVRFPDCFEPSEVDEAARFLAGLPQSR